MVAVVCNRRNVLRKKTKNTTTNMSPRTFKSSAQRTGNLGPYICVEAWQLLALYSSKNGGSTAAALFHTPTFKIQTRAMTVPVTSRGPKTRSRATRQVIMQNFQSHKFRIYMPFYSIIKFFPLMSCNLEAHANADDVALVAGTHLRNSDEILDGKSQVKGT